MLILHAGNFGTRAKGAALHSVAPKLSRGLVRNGHVVVDFADREVARAATPFGSRKFGAWAANRALTQIALDMRPDLLLLGHADTIFPKTITELRAALPALRVLQWNIDPLFEPDNVARILSKQAVVDATLISTAGPALAALRIPGKLLGFLPNPVDVSIETGQAHTNPNCTADLFFAASSATQPPRHLAGQSWPMPDLLNALQKSVPGLRLRTGFFNDKSQLVGVRYQQALADTAIGLNASRRNDFFLYSSDRLAQFAGNGLAILIDRATGYDTLFAPHEFAFFDDFDSLTAQLRRLIADPPARQALAAAGRARYHELFNEQIIARYVLNVAMVTHNPADYPFPTLT